jgi:hypothetical protein
VDDRDAADAWCFEGRYYGVVVCAGPEQVTVELEDLAPAPGRGTAAVVTFADDGAAPVVAVYARDLPLALLRQFLEEAERNQPSVSG